MVKCPNCQAEHPENTLLCSECGFYLLESPKETLMTVAGVDWVEREETNGAPEVDIASPLGLKLTILDSGREVEVPLTKEVNIGRLDEASASFPEVDLTSDGLEKGISRRHARITKRGNQVFIEDLGSINGTSLNRKKLIPYLPHVLKNGDELQLGKLILRVNFK